MTNGKKFIILSSLVFISIFVTSCASSKIIRTYWGDYYYDFGNGRGVTSSLRSDLEIMLKYPKVVQAFKDDSLPINHDEMKSYSISEPDSQGYITIKLDRSSARQEKVVTKKIQLSDKYEAGTIPKIPQSMLDQYKAFLDEELSNPDFIARSNRLRNEIDAKIIQREKDEATAKQLGYASVNDYHTALDRQSFNNFMRRIQAGAYGYGIPFVEGDVFDVPTSTLVGIDRVDTPDGILYLARIYGDDIGKAIYILTNRELSLVPAWGSYIIYEPMRLKYIGPAQYTQGRVQTVDSWLFERIN